MSTTDLRELIDGQTRGPSTHEGELAEIIVLEQRAEQSQMLIMTQIRKKRADALMSKEGPMISLVPHAHELKGTREWPRSNVDGL
jgi:hypothetical protein